MTGVPRLPGRNRGRGAGSVTAAAGEAQDPSGRRRRQGARGWQAHRGLKPVADGGVGAEDAEDVRLAFDGGGERAELDGPVLGDRGDAESGTRPNRQARSRPGWRRYPPRRSTRGGRCRTGRWCGALLGAQAGEAVHGGAAVRAVAPGAAGPPGELGGVRRGRQRLARREQRGDVDAVVDGRSAMAIGVSLVSGGIGPAHRGWRRRRRTTGRETRPRRTRPSPCAQDSAPRSAAICKPGYRPSRAPERELAGQHALAFRCARHCDGKPWPACPGAAAECCPARLRSSRPAPRPGPWGGPSRRLGTPREGPIGRPGRSASGPRAAGPARYGRLP